MATIGVKVELEGAQAYKQSMSQVTNQTKLYQAQVKNLGEQIKNGTSVFQNHIKQGQALEKQLASQKEQARLLSEEIKRVSQAQGEDSAQVLKLQTQYENLQTAISKTEQALKENGGTFGALSAQIDQIGQKISSVGEKVSSLGDNLTKNLTGPIVALGSASVAAFKSVDAGLDTIVAKTGATGESLKEMQDIARNISKEVPASFDNIGEAVGEVNTRFGLTGDELETLSTQFLEFAKLNGTNVSSSIDAVQQSMAAFGLDASQASLFLDTLNKAGQDTGVSVDTLASQMATNAVYLKELGYNASDSAMFLANLSKNGIDASQVMTGMKKAFSESVSEGKSMDEAIADLQNTMNNASSSTEAYQKAIDLFGAKAGPAIANACQEGRLSFEQLNTSMEDFSGSVTNTFDATKSPIDSFTTNMNQLKLLGYDIANSMAPMITQAMTSMSNVVTKLSNAWNGLSTKQQETILKVAGIVAVIGPALSILGRVITTVGSITSGISTLVGFLPVIGATITGTVIPAITGVMTALLPVLPIIIGVGAAIVGVIAIVQNWGAITDWFSEKWNTFTAWFNTTITNISTWWTNLWTTVSTRVTEGVSSIGTKVREGITNLKTNITNGLNNVVNVIREKLGNMKQHFIDLKDSALTWGRDMIQNFINGILEKWEALKQTVANVAQTVADYLHFSQPKKGPLSDFNESGGDMMQNFAEGIRNAKYLVEQAVGEVAMDVNSILTDPIDYERVYDAIRQGASDSTTKVILNNREVSRALNGMGVVFNG